MGNNVKGVMFLIVLLLLIYMQAVSCQQVVLDAKEGDGEDQQVIADIVPTTTTQHRSLEETILKTRGMVEKGVHWDYVIRHKKPSGMLQWDYVVKKSEFDDDT